MRTPDLNTGQLDLHYLRYIVAGEAAGAWDEFGAMGATPTNLARIPELSVTQSVEVAFVIIVAGEAAGAWGEFGGLGATLTTLAHILELSVAQSVEIAVSHEKLQHAAQSSIWRESVDMWKLSRKN